MVCPKCYGKGERGCVEWDGVKCCPECQGSGIVSCCDTAGASEERPTYPKWTMDFDVPENRSTWRRLLGDVRAVPKDKVCKICGGTGDKPGVDDDCPACDGYGIAEPPYLKPEDYWADVDKALEKRKNHGAV